MSERHAKTERCRTHITANQILPKRTRVHTLTSCLTYRLIVIDESTRMQMGWLDMIHETGTHNSRSQSKSALQSQSPHPACMCVPVAEGCGYIPCKLGVDGTRTGAVLVPSPSYRITRK